MQEGSIGHDVVIKPVPFGLINSENSQSESRAHHIVYRRKVNEADEFSDFGMSNFELFRSIKCFYQMLFTQKLNVGHHKLISMPNKERLSRRSID